MIFRFTILVLAFICSLAINAQDLPEGTEKQLENLSEIMETEPEDDNFLQQLEFYKLHRLNINTATKEDLQSFKLLTGLQIGNLLQ